MPINVLSVFMYAPCGSLVPMEVRRRQWIPWNRSYRGLIADIWVLGIKPRWSVRETRVKQPSHLSNPQDRVSCILVLP